MAETWPAIHETYFFLPGYTTKLNFPVSLTVMAMSLTFRGDGSQNACEIFQCCYASVLPSVSHFSFNTSISPVPGVSYTLGLLGHRVILERTCLFSS